MREKRFWSDSIKIPLARNIPLYPASPEGIARAMEGFLFEKGSQTAAGGTEPAFPVSQAAGARLDSYVERIVGSSLSWAQACSMIQPITPGLADKLRRYLGTEFALPLPASIMERLYRLPGTWEAAAGIAFSWPVLKILRRGFRTYWQPDEQEKIIAFILKEVDLTRPVQAKEGRPSLAELKWQALRTRIELETAPDSALPKLEKLLETPVGPAISAELAALQSRENPGGLPLCREPVKKESRHLLTVMAGGRSAVRSPGALAFRLIGVIFTVLCLLFGDIEIADLAAKPGTQNNLVFTGVEPATVPARVEAKGADGWQYVKNMNLETDKKYTLTDLLAQSPAKTSDLRFYLYAQGYREQVDVNLNPQNRLVSVNLRRGEVRVPGLAEYPDARLTVRYCPEALYITSGSGHSSWIATPTPAPADKSVLFGGNWKARGLERGADLGDRELSVGLEFIYHDLADKKAAKLYSEWRDRLLATSSVDFIYRVDVPSNTTEPLNAALFKQLERDLGPLSGKAQLIAWDNSSGRQDLLPAELTNHFSAILDYTGNSGSNWCKSLLDILNTGRQPYFVAQNAPTGTTAAVLLFPVIAVTTPSRVASDTSSFKPTSVPTSSPAQTHETPDKRITSVDIKQLLAERSALSHWQGSGKLHLKLNYGIDPIRSVAFSPDGRLLATGSDDGCVRLWEAASGKLLSSLTGHSDSVYSVAFSPDGKFLASGSLDKTVKLWDVATNKSLSSLTGHSDSVYSVAFSPDGKLLASGSGDYTVRLWDVATNRLLSSLTGHSNSVYSVAFSPDGKFLASGSGDYTMNLWDVATNKLLSTLTGHSSYVYSVAFSPDGKLLASGSGDNTVRLWDVATNRLLSTLTGHSNSVYSVAFSPDGKFLASGSLDKTVKLWDVATYKLLSTLTGHSSYVYSVAFSPDGKLLASGSWDNTVKLWNVTTNKSLSSLIGHSSYVYSLAFSPDGKLLASGFLDNTVKLWNVATNQLLSSLTGHSSYVSSVAFSPDGKLLASGSLDKTVKLWSVASNQLLSSLTGHSYFVYSVAFSPDGKLLASGSGDYTVRLWDVATNRLLSTLTGHSNSVYSVAFSPDGRLLASGSGDYTVRLWDVATSRLLSTLTGHSSYVSSVAFSPDGKLLASGSLNKTVKLWDVATNKLLSTITGHSDSVYSMAFSPDGKLLASGLDDNTVKLWDVATNKLLSTLTGHSDYVHSVAFSPDGMLLASGSRDIKLSLCTGKELADYLDLVTRGNNLRLTSKFGISHLLYAWDADSVHLVNGLSWCPLPTSSGKPIEVYEIKDQVVVRELDNPSLASSLDDIFNYNKGASDTPITATISYYPSNTVKPGATIFITVSVSTKGSKGNSILYKINGFSESTNKLFNNLTFNLGRIDPGAVTYSTRAVEIPADMKSQTIGITVNFEAAIEYGIPPLESEIIIQPRTPGMGKK